MAMTPHVSCKFIGTISSGPHTTALVELLEDHPRQSGSKGDQARTTKLKSIDFERGIAVTQNTIYLFEPVR